MNTNTITLQEELHLFNAPHLLHIENIKQQLHLLFLHDELRQDVHQQVMQG